MHTYISYTSHTYVSGGIIPAFGIVANGALDWRICVQGPLHISAANVASPEPTLSAWRCLASHVSTFIPQRENDKRLIWWEMAMHVN